ncbi:hypothetical protein SERLA73DRAFT_163984 [Serpula lacrymans var. lacrymans S7.3]|uniref:Uncharacterized protein n=2 Tax=Serpula lacrymans var. lacrymans TaxID=341189 RepID=F8QGJ1_SERL3|nr:uncharacterized protein SERLADRAFT_433291 [Serpula lacrymans var. lacrymans S7.9]EGN92537.1 hypothetical protein SERLA73DRAFT_163984 [Serpula lacrymans var. lacrymans S7.3]EGO29283.1 hypothetical protein SERLADRAFT_433291 [Serpula lacrymans var. lacrymans S7.9]
MSTPTISQPFIYLPPTSHLPPISRLASFTATQLLDALAYLRLLYSPEVRGSRRRRRDIIPSPQSPLTRSTTFDCESDTDLLRSDAFERSYAIRWLTALISRHEIWDAEDEIDKDESTHKTPTMSITDPSSLLHGEESLSKGIEQILLSKAPSYFPNQAEIERLLQEAASLLAICAGAAAAGTFTRTFTFGSDHPSHATVDGTFHPGKVEVRLTDLPLENDDYKSVGAQTWGGACVMAEMIAEKPSDFGLVATLENHQEVCQECQGSCMGPSTQEFRVLELGAGTGLVSLTIAKVIENLRNVAMPCGGFLGQRKNTIIASDFFPSVLANLHSNILTNFPSSDNDPRNSSSPAISITSRFLDWSEFFKATSNSCNPTGFGSVHQLEDILDRPFDLILGADIIYESQHATWIKTCVETLLRRPEHYVTSKHSMDLASQVMDEPLESGKYMNANPAIFHLIIPLRPTHTMESNTIEKVFRFSPSFGINDKKINVSCQSTAPFLKTSSSPTYIASPHEPELVVLSKQTFFCEASTREVSTTSDEVEYVYYKIGWDQEDV